MTLREGGAQVDETYFIGDMPKDRVLRQFLPHLFFDDKPENARLAAAVVPSVHVPFGISNITGAIREDGAGRATGAADPARP
jgi:5'-nucleotidase